MQLIRFQYADEFQGTPSNPSTFNNTFIDTTTNVDTENQYVAISPLTTVTGGTTVDGSVGPKSGGGWDTVNGTWTTIGPYYVTSSSGAYVEYIVPSGIVGIQIQLSGVLAPHPRLYPSTTLFPSAIHDGAIATISRNGTQIASLDCYNTVPTSPFLIVAAGDHIRITHSGLHNSTYTPSGSTMIAVLAVTTSSGSGGTSGTFKSPVMDSQEEDTSWFKMGMDTSYMGNTGGASIDFAVGNTPTPDGTWTTTNFPLLDLLDASGTRYGIGQIGLMAMPQGRYAQWTFNFPVGLTSTTWFRNVDVFHWVPYRDPDFLTNFSPVGLPWTPGPKLHALIGEPAARSAKTREENRDIISAQTIAGAKGKYLVMRAKDLGTKVYTGEPPASARARLQSLLASRAQAGSPTVMAQQVGRLVSGQDVTVSSTLTSGLQTVSATNSTMTSGPVKVAQTGPWAITVTIPPPIGSGYPGLPGISVSYAKQIITDLVSSLCPLGVYVGTAGGITPTFQ